MGEGKKGAKMLAEYVKITKTQIGTKKERTRNDERNCKWTRKRITKTANEN
jgi:hypothetical protein